VGVEDQTEMENALAIIVAVETYKEKTIKPVLFAEADAREFSEAMAALGIASQEVLVNEDATKSRIESLIKTHLRRINADDQLFFFYAGHGFALNERNYILANDTLRADLAGTSVGVKWILEQINNSKCERVAMFLDACASGITTAPEVRGLYTSMSDEELDKFFGQSKYRVCFSSCRADEESYSARDLKHGIWSYHVLEAIRGNVPALLEKKRYLTATALQGYVSKEVPLTLRKAFTSQRFVQTPWKYGSENRDFVVADLGEVLARRNATPTGYQQLKQILFRELEKLSIKSLSGFKKGHFVPRDRSLSSRNFVESASTEDVTRRLEEVFEKIREHMKYKRKELTIESGRIITPDFEYALYYELDAEDLAKVVRTSMLNNVRPGILGSQEFNAVFADEFDEVVFELLEPVNVEKFIDTIEDAELDAVEIDYPPDYAKCVVEFEDVTITVSKHEIAVSDGSSKSPKELMKLFLEIQPKLVGNPILQLLSS
jgi:hypothetical protein